MIDKRVETIEAALAGLGDGARLMLSGFGGAGFPVALLRGVEAMGARELTLIMNTLRLAQTCAPGLCDDERVVRAICSAARAREEELLLGIEAALPRLLRPGGRMLLKIMDGPEAQEIDKRLRRSFGKAGTVKPQASRKGTTERYLFADAYRGEPG